MTASSEDLPTSGRIEQRAHLFPVRIYYEDTDLSGAVYHSNYVKFFERGRSEFLRLAGITHSGMLQRPEPIAFAVTKMNIDYRAAARIDDALIVRTRFLSARGARMQLDQALLRDGQAICQAAVEVVCVDPIGGRPRRLPQEIIGAMAPFIHMPEA